MQKKPAEPAAPTLPSTVGDEASPPPLSKRKQKSALRLQEFQKKKHAELCKRFLDHWDPWPRLAWWLDPAVRATRVKLLVKLHTLLRRAWARHRPIDGGAVLGPTSPRERHVYNRAAKFYYVAFALDPGESGRTLDAWLRRAPMETDEPAPAAAS